MALGCEPEFHRMPFLWVVPANVHFSKNSLEQPLMLRGVYEGPGGRKLPCLQGSPLFLPHPWLTGQTTWTCFDAGQGVTAGIPGLVESVSSS